MEEGGRIPGPPGKSVRGRAQPSRVRPGGDAALDCSAPPLTARYKLQIGLLYVSRYLQLASIDLLPVFDPNAFEKTINHLKMGKGVTLTKEELKALKTLLEELE